EERERENCLEYFWCLVHTRLPVNSNNINNNIINIIKHQQKKGSRSFPRDLGWIEAGSQSLVTLVPKLFRPEICTREAFRLNNSPPPTTTTPTTTTTTTATTTATLRNTIAITLLQTLLNNSIISIIIITRR